TFHNGKSLTVDDVVASIQYHMGENSTSAAKTLLASVVDVRAQGDDAVVFELQSGNADFPYLAADYHLAIMPSEEGVLNWRSGIGTGGYQIKQFEPGVRLLLERNKNYWKP